MNSVQIDYADNSAIVNPYYSLSERMTKQFSGGAAAEISEQSGGLLWDETYWLSTFRNGSPSVMVSSITIKVSICQFAPISKRARTPAHHAPTYLPHLILWPEPRPDWQAFESELGEAKTMQQLAAEQLQFQAENKGEWVDADLPDRW